mmetsp:Transcript_4970/g.12578  ORF Transcript_4970/g.12578 Transcript_4970/m.12578 type:complete len:425 (+) Transcript_4970:284-1558(+)
MEEFRAARREADEADERAHPGSQRPELRLNCVNSNHVKWVPLLLAGGAGNVEVVEHFVGVGALYLTEEMQQRAVEAAEDLHNTKAQLTHAIAQLQHLQKEQQRATEQIDKTEAQVALVRKQLQNLPNHASRQRNRLSQDLAALQRDLRQARTLRQDVTKALEEQRAIEDEHSKSLPKKNAALDRLSGSLGDHAANTALHWACINGRAGVAELLLQKGVLPDARDSQGDTALHCAVGHGHVECVLAFADNVASEKLVSVLGALNKRGQLAFDLAYDPECRRALAKAMRKCGRTFHKGGTRVGLKVDNTPLKEEGAPLEPVPFDSKTVPHQAGYPIVKLPFSGPPYSLKPVSWDINGLFKDVDLNQNELVSKVELASSLELMGLDEGPDYEALIASIPDDKEYTFDALRLDLLPKIKKLLVDVSCG